MENNNILNGWEIFGIVLLIIFMCVGPWLFTQEGAIDFSKTGEIGDTIGGITAPFVNLLAAFLVYKSFSAQIQANREQRKNHNSQMNLIRKEQSLDSIIRLYDLVEEQILKNESYSAPYTIMTELQNSVNKYFQNNKYPPSGYDSKKAKQDIGILFYRKMALINKNLNYMLIVANSIESYSNLSAEDFYSRNLSVFYSSKLKLLLEELKYYRLESLLREIEGTLHDPAKKQFRLALENFSILRVNMNKLPVK